jgi:hypothetical protein
MCHNYRLHSNIELPTPGFFALLRVLTTGRILIDADL